MSTRQHLHYVVLLLALAMPELAETPEACMTSDAQVHRMLVGPIDGQRQAAKERGRHRRQITETEVGDTLAAICEAPKQSVAA